MNPLKLRGEGYGRFDSFDIELPAGTAAVVGPNGAGKSRLLNAVELCLFAGRGELAQWLAPGHERLLIELMFEHAGETYRIRRMYQGGSRGRQTVDFERHVFSGANGPSDAPGGWDTLTCEDAKATDALIASTVGLTRDTFNASCFLGQGNSAMFTDAKPADRKALLGSILDPHNLWPRLAERARTEARAADMEQLHLLGQINDRMYQIEKGADAELDVENYSDEEHTARLALRTAESRLEDAQQLVVVNAAAAERVRTLTDADAYARSERDRVSAELIRARGAERELAEAEAALVVLEAVAASVSDIEAKVEAQREARAAAEAAQRERDRGFERAAGLAATATRLAEEGDALDAQHRILAEQHVHLNAAGTARCPTCEQLLGAEAREAALKTLAGQLDGLDAQMTAKTVHLTEARELAQRAQDEAAAIELPPVPAGDFTVELQDARAAAVRVAATQARIDGLRELAGQLPEWEAALSLRNRALEKTGAELADALVDAPDVAALDADVVHAKRTVADARATLEAAVHDLTRARQQLEQLAAAKLEWEGLARAREEKLAQLDVLKLAERAFGRDGIPALIAENAIPAIEQEANRILELMPTAKGETLRVELRTQRELKTAEHLRETLDIMVVDAYRPRPYETYSGGEHGRINIALRLALSKLLTTRRGAESRLLVLDEVPHLDALGEEQLVQVVLDGPGSYDRVLVVTHSNIRDVFETAIELASDDAGMSFVVGSEAPVLQLAEAAR